MTSSGELAPLLQAALESGQSAGLESCLQANSHLPGPRANLALLDAFANAVGGLLRANADPIGPLDALLDRWSESRAAVTEPGVMLPCAAAIARGQIAATLPAQWSHQMHRLRQTAQDERWRVREMVATGLQRTLSTDWDRTYAALLEWAGSDNPLVIRAAIAATAEPALLKAPGHADHAFAVQQQAVQQLAAFPPGERRSESVRVLRQALGYSISVVTVATPDTGFELLLGMARSEDDDLRWVVAENLKKNRLNPWPGKVAQLRAELTAAARP